jgi:hypothetical protein
VEDVIYCPDHLNPSLQNIIDLLVGAKTPLYNSYINEQQRPPFDFEIMKRPLYSGEDGDSLIITCQPFGYQKLCIKMYPRLQFRKGYENGQRALQLFNNSSAMKVLQEKKMIPPYRAVFSDKGFIYCIYEHIDGDTLTSHFLQKMPITTTRNTFVEFPDIPVAIRSQLRMFSDNLLESGFYMGGLLNVPGKLASDNIIVNAEGCWIISDLDALFDLSLPTLSLDAQISSTQEPVSIDKARQYMDNCIVEGLKHAYTMKYLHSVAGVCKNTTDRC